MENTNPIIQLLKNPIVIGLLALGITYGHLYYKEYKRRKENPEAKEKQVDWTTPAMVGALCWFLSASYFDNDNIIDDISEESSEKMVKIHNKVSNYIKKVSSKTESESDSLSYHFVKKGDIVIPDLDVFLDVGEF
jgi:iron-sulfur cluster repair protein YtfE (RIC family)